MRRVWVLVILVLTAACGVDQDLVDALIGIEDVELIFPENVSECTEGTIISESLSEVVFRWLANEEDVTYQVNLTNLISNSTELYHSNNTELPIILERGIPYSWFVADSLSGNPRSEVWTFYNAGPGVESFIPFPAEAIAPAQEAIIETVSSVNLIWLANDLDDDIAEYDVYFGQNENPSLLQQSVTTSFFNDIPVISGNTYYWKVITRDFIGNESNSEIFRFQVE
ncbi:hypothetical protein EJ994_06635 [Maribacter sp. MJ134]|uniref:hypothetical protein n=1 Tax=Maribacter sp. MJ134 TaxID=2496865 RepID=UPI000F84A28C|nr:hypothetical protein [Maribacter sp. MJ134]AZQ58498.1 hypothetical protein EJ994_06635 [Maribacter sp. MJ134]